MPLPHYKVPRYLAVDWKAWVISHFRLSARIQTSRRLIVNRLTLVFKLSAFFFLVYRRVLLVTRRIAIRPCKIKHHIPPFPPRQSGSFRSLARSLHTTSPPPPLSPPSEESNYQSSQISESSPLITSTSPQWATLVPSKFPVPRFA